MVKNGLKAKKIKLHQMNFFSQKTTNKIFRYQIAPFILQNFKTFLESKMAHLFWTKFFSTNHCYYFHLPIGPFYYAKFEKILKVVLELWCTIFGFKMVHSPQTNFFWKIIKIILIYLLAPFIVQNFEKILPADPELWGCTVFGPKIAHFPKLYFFSSENLLMSLLSFIHAYLHAKNQSQILIY